MKEYENLKPIQFWVLKKYMGTKTLWLDQKLDLK